MVRECRKRRASQLESSSEDTDPVAAALDCSGVSESSSDEEHKAKRRRIKKHYLSRARENTTLAAMRCCRDHIHGTRGGSLRRAS